MSHSALRVMIVKCRNFNGEGMLLLSKLLHNACNKVESRLVLLLVIAVYIGNSNVRDFSILLKILDDGRSVCISRDIERIREPWRSILTQVRSYRPRLDNNISL